LRTGAPERAPLDMTYALGVDLGTTYTAAAIARKGRAEMAALGYRATSVPTVVLLTTDGRFLVGDAAERRAAQEPDRVAREFKRRVGDPTPLLLGGTPIAVDRCLAEVLRWVVTTIGENEGGPPATVTVTHPANWGEFKRDVLREALRMVEVPDARLLAEPVAAATWYAQAERLAPGRTIAVYDLGGGTFDAAVLRRQSDGRFESLGRAEGIERLGGIDVDQAVFGHVLRALGQDGGASLEEADDPGLVTAAAQLRRACVEAKEALSSETSVTIPVWLPGMYHEVLLQRAELEELVGPVLRPTLDVLGRVVASAGLQPGDLDAVLLIGGSSRIPLIARQVSAGLGRPVVVDAHPKHPVALGAALDAGARLAALPASTAAPSAASAPTTIVLPPEPGPATIVLPPGPSQATSIPPARPTGSTLSVPPRDAAGSQPAAPVPGPAPFRSLPPLPPPRPPHADADPQSRRMLLVASLATPVVLLLVIVLVVLQGRRTPTGDATTGSTAGTRTTTSPGGGGGDGGQATATTAGDSGLAQLSLLATDPSPALDGFATIYETPPRVRRIVLYTDFAVAEVQVPDEPTYVDEYQWRDGQVTGPEPLQLMEIDVDELESKLFDLPEVDPSVIPAAGQQTLQACAGEGLELTHVIIERDLVFDDQHRVLLNVYASHPERGGGGYISYALDGTPVADHCS
jgi:actin-like ATPase involved in cell morphogenesis